MIQLVFAGARVTCYVIDKPKAPPGFAGRGLLDILQPALELITLAKQGPHHLGTAEKQRDPSQVGGLNLVALRRHQTAAPIDRAGRPCGVDQITVTVRAKELERRIGWPGVTGLPVTNGAQRNAQELRRLISSEAAENSGIAELCVADYRTMRRFV